MLTDKQRDELKELGLQNVRFKLAGSPGGRAATLNQFLPSGDVTKGDVEDWLLENSLAETAQQNAILFWARVGGVAGIVAAFDCTMADHQRGLANRRDAPPLPAAPALHPRNRPRQSSITT